MCICVEFPLSPQLLCNTDDTLLPQLGLVMQRRERERERFRAVIFKQCIAECRAICPLILRSQSLNVAHHANSANSCAQCAEFGSTARAAQ